LQLQAATQRRANEKRTRRHIQEVKLILPKIPDRANVTGNECAAAAIEVEANRGMARISSSGRRDWNGKKKEEERRKS
jgi:hypothetical protein